MPHAVLGVAGSRHAVGVGNIISDHRLSRVAMHLRIRLLKPDLHHCSASTSALAEPAFLFATDAPSRKSAPIEEGLVYLTTRLIFGYSHIFK